MSCAAPACWTPSTWTWPPTPPASPTRRPPAGSSNGPWSPSIPARSGRTTCTAPSAPRCAPTTTTPRTAGHPPTGNEAAKRALAALGRQWQDAGAPVPARPLLVACLRQGLSLARDHHLDDLAWLTDAAFAYTDDSVWEPLAPPTPPATPGAGQQPEQDTPADALAELLDAIARRQHEHRARTAERLTTVLATGLLSGRLTGLALYYRAKAHKDLGRSADALDGMRQVAEKDGRLAPRARRGMANLARIRGDFPAALAAVPGLGWRGRHYRVLGDVHWPQADFDNAITAFEHARAEAEQHNAAGERAIAQTRLALATAFADPERADNELALARQLLEPLDQRATTLLAQVAGLVRDAGTNRDVPDRATLLRTHIDVAGLAWLTPLLETALAFHHAVQTDHDGLTAAIDRLREATANGDYTYLLHIAAAMGGLPQPTSPAIQWLDDAHTVRTRWHTLVTARRHHLNGPTAG
ncbi:tetratricopeptide repeat protein [Streptomyces sp. NPDC006012]|uniref:tetratricopeptide repeat protein n=1 Tax=Streptomyces sp. NPDC006012 TaxID=3364739 RepID=UPI0036C712AA